MFERSNRGYIITRTSPRKLSGQNGIKLNEDKTMQILNRNEIKNIMAGGGGGLGGCYIQCCTGGRELAMEVHKLWKFQTVLSNVHQMNSANQIIYLILVVIHVLIVVAMLQHYVIINLQITKLIFK